ncbi:MAG: DUF2062 domain-containing protein [Betaproteobacteria bacterium]|nr:DUF2062 domain-containing protein [Betaproteobacteria bacterium]MSQ88620.1 DUF2062 domain-containing protein [Betaproteobacteria bacterium]
MPRKFFRRFLPDQATIRTNKYLAWLGAWLHHPNLWHLNRDAVAGGVAIGLFAGLVPGPLQMLAAVLLAIPLKKNLPVAVLLTLYTNPFTIVPLYLLAIAYGRLLLGADLHPVTVEPYSWDWAHWIDSLQGMTHWMLSLGKPLAIGLPALGLTLAALGYAAVQLGWRAYVVIAWRARAQRRTKRNVQ